MFFAGDLNGHSQAWWPDGDTNAEGVRLDNMFSELTLTRLIAEPTRLCARHAILRA